MLGGIICGLYLTDCNSRTASVIRTSLHFAPQKTDSMVDLQICQSSDVAKTQHALARIQPSAARTESEIAIPDLTIYAALVRLIAYAELLLTISRLPQKSLDPFWAIH